MSNCSLIGMRPDQFRFEIEFSESVSEDFQNYFQRMARRVRINLVKKQLEVWFIHTKDGPTLEFIEWLASKTIDLKIDEIFKDSVNRKLRCRHATMIDHQLIYDYGAKDVMTHYICWEYEKFKEV